MRKTCGKVPSTAAISGDITIGFTVRIADAATFANARVLPEDGGMIVDRTIRPPSSKAPDVA